MRKQLLAICLLATVCVCGCAAMLGKPSQLSISKDSAGTRPERGLFVTKVFPKSPAMAAGIKVMDVITQYGEFQIVDDAGFFAARNHYDRPLSPTVEIVVWRGVSRMTAKVPTGWLGVSTQPIDKTSVAFSSLMIRFDGINDLPEYIIAQESKFQVKETPSELLQKAKALIDQAERDATLTPAQVLVSRIYMIPDDAPEQDQRRRAELLNQIIETQPENFIHMLGNDVFFESRRFRAAIVCLKHHLKTSPDDVSMRLNLASAYNSLGMYEDADAATDYVFDNKLRVSEYGRMVGYNNKATAALGGKDYRNCIQFAEKGYAFEPNVFALMLIQLAAAQTGDTQSFERAVQQLQRAHPREYTDMEIHLDVVQAYALVKKNQPDAARKLVGAWKNTDQADLRVFRYWRDFPGGTDVVRNWSELMKRS